MELIKEIEFELPGCELEFIPVTFTAKPEWENDGIGSYEFQGAKGFDSGTDYVSLERWGDPVWDKSKFTAEQNVIIETWLYKSAAGQELCDEFCSIYAKENPRD